MTVGQRLPASSHLPGASPARSGVPAGSPGTACEAGEARALATSFRKREVGKEQSAAGCHRAPAGTRQKHPEQSRISSHPVGTAACSPLEQEFELNSFPSCYLPSSFPGLPAPLSGLGRPLPQRSFVPGHTAPDPRRGQKREVKRSCGSTTPPWEAGSSSWPCRELSIRPDRRSMTDGGTQLELQPLSLSPPRLTNTSQGAESIQELLVLLQVHFPPRSSAGRHRGTHKLRPLSPAQHSRWTPLSRPLTTGNVSLFDEAHESLPGLRPPPFLQMSPAQQLPRTTRAPRHPPSQLAGIVCPGDISSKERVQGNWEGKEKNPRDLRLAGRR